MWELIFGQGISVSKAKILNRPPSGTSPGHQTVQGHHVFFSERPYPCRAGFPDPLCPLARRLWPRAIQERLFDPPLASLPIAIHASKVTADANYQADTSRTICPLMDYSEEIPDSARTFLVMPVIISTKEQGLEYVERLHKHYLANRQPNLYFALLADYADAQGKEMPSDKEIRDTLVSRTEQLNRRYPPAHRKFSLFIRERKWNQSEGCLACWE